MVVYPGIAVGKPRICGAFIGYHPDRIWSCTEVSFTAVREPPDPGTPGRPREGGASWRWGWSMDQPGTECRGEEDPSYLARVEEGVWTMRPDITDLHGFSLPVLQVVFHYTNFLAFKNITNEAPTIDGWTP